jgi:hypothetical protein
MYFAHVRYFKHLHGTKTVIGCFLLLVFCMHSVNAQQNRVENKAVINLPNFDAKRVHFGFYLALNYASYRIKRSDYMAHHPDSIKSVSPVGSPGFTLGFIFNLKLNDYLDLRLVPGVAFYERIMSYQFAQTPQNNQTLESTMAEFPLLLKMKSERRGNHRMYFLIGGKYSMASGLRKRDEKPDQLRTLDYDVSIDYGFGFDIYYEYFKFSPEIRFSHGLMQTLVHDPNQYANALSQMHTHTVTISFHFQ